MTDPFDWTGLWRKTADVFKKHGENIAATTIDDMDRAAAAYLRERIEAAFVPVEEYRQLERLHDGLQDVAQGLTARAEARVKALEEALQWVLDHDPKRPGLRFESYEGLLESLMGRLRQALGDNHE